MARTGAANDGVKEHVEFVVKAAEELILEGSERRIVRVPADTPYSCLMLKNQRFSSLFRHYAKHHGLRKEDLVYYFTEKLRNEDTPESVFLQGRDEIVVKKRPTEEGGEDGITSAFRVEQICPNSRFLDNIASLRDDNEHCDVKFFVGAEREEVVAHKAILVARSDYFAGMFRRGMRESGTHEVEVASHTPDTMRRLLEFVYTNRVEDLSGCTYVDVMRLLSIADEYLMRDLKALCEYTVRESIDVNNVAKLLEAAEDHSAAVLKNACVIFIKKNMREVCSNTSFEAQICNSPALSLSILKALAEKDGTGGASSNASGSSSPDSRAKKRRREGEVASIANN